MKLKELLENKWVKKIYSKNVVILILMALTLPIRWTAETLNGRDIYGFPATALGIFTLDMLTPLETVFAVSLLLVPGALVGVYLLESFHKNIAKLICFGSSIIFMLAVIFLDRVLATNGPIMLLVFALVMLITLIPDIIHTVENFFIHFLYRNTKSVSDHLIRIIAAPVTALFKLADFLFKRERLKNLFLISLFWLIPVIIGLAIVLL
ncbi:MAG TPA: hypothetical protein VKS21_12545 [Spirochaetota bacterium]|nr:hypothetical protein [Spirochaetota bacterium]